MLINSSNMVNKSLLAFTMDDKEFAIWTIKNDSVVDEINNKMMKKAIKKSSGSNEEKRAFNKLYQHEQRGNKYRTNCGPCNKHCRSSYLFH